MLMYRRRNVVIGLVSALLSGVLVYVLHVMQVIQAEEQQLVSVVVPAQFIDAGKLLTEDMLTLKSIVSSSYDERMFQKVSDVVGQETGLALGKGEPILDWKLNKFHLLPNEKQSTFQIPKSYILSVSNGIRAGDRVRLYLSSTEADGPSGKLFDEEIVVASVKTAANVEVDDVQHSSLMAKVSGDEEQHYMSRRYANAAIDQINLNLTEQQWLEIDRLCRLEHVKLVIAYTSSYDATIHEDQSIVNEE